MKHKQKGVDSNTVLAYQSPPSCFLVRSKQKRKMVFCIATLLNNINMTTTRSRGLGSKVIQWTRYIHALIDVYLKMGRFLSPKWSPDTWLFASIELFRCDIGSSHNHQGVELLSHLSGKCIDMDDHRGVSVKHSISFLFSIAFLRAVLTNVHEHSLQNTTESMSVGDRTRKLMQFVLAKIYDLRMHYKQTLLCSEDNAHERVQLAVRLFQ
jgi:hypothetical protein